MFKTYLINTSSGQILAPIDIPSFSWKVTVSRSNFITTKKGTFEEATINSGVQIPWEAIPGHGSNSKSRLYIDSYTNGIAMTWQSPYSGEEWPVLYGAIGDRKDTYEDTSFNILSIMDLLGERILVPEKSFGFDPIKGTLAEASNNENQLTHVGTTSAEIKFNNRSWRAILANVGKLCTDAKPNGDLPIDWDYFNEQGAQEIKFEGFDVKNNNCARIFDNIANRLGGPDVQFRPYFKDSSTIRVKFIAGSDADHHIPQFTKPVELNSFRGGGSIDNLAVGFKAGVSRVYGTGAGKDKAMLCCLAERIDGRDPRLVHPLIEKTSLNGEASSYETLRDKTEAELALRCLPVMQVAGDINANDSDLIAPGRFWPGELVHVTIEDFPSLNDDVYTLRLMEMSGDASGKVHLVFDTAADPGLISTVRS